MALLETTRPWGSLFCVFSWETNSFHCVLFLPYRCLPAGAGTEKSPAECWDSLSFHSHKKKKALLWLNFICLLTLQQQCGLCCFCFVDEFILCVISPLNFKDMYLHEKNKGRKSTCKLLQEKPVLKTISLLTDGRISWKASTIFTKSNPFRKPKKCYLILSTVYVYVLE